ncbi:hypothetical protein LPB142_03085 [Rhodobacter xanthinilyticus]|uniref:Arginine transporter n=1 Tax=Rhodobacter xanthinilyticus TaxID=1850250 RepID=A0A1D9M9C3_9RHOB|nr:hypothetical protein [Rhodobacter xanthinilyticus]AOZ68421.1 hypothetical protein LPB142_03085 [Rhodobacter xanthinilyticus]
MKISLLAAAFVALGTSQALAGAIDSACLKTGRSAANRELCGCVQRVADMTLSKSDQRRAAKFFKDPDMAQQVRMSDSASDEAFWARYKQFAGAAENYCSN